MPRLSVKWPPLRDVTRNHQDFHLRSWCEI